MLRLIKPVHPQKAPLDIWDILWGNVVPAHPISMASSDVRTTALHCSRESKTGFPLFTSIICNSGQL